MKPPELPSQPSAAPHPPTAELAGQVAVVTGSSTGIGRAIALELARGGADLLVHARSSAAEAEETAARVRALGRQAAVVLADLADTAAQDALIEAAFAWQGRVEIWVNNAGADTLTGAAREWSFDQKLEVLLDVDVTATVRIAHHAGVRMKRAGRGAIVNIGWDQAEHGMAGDSGELFAAAKGAIMAFSRSLALSLGPEVRVNCLAPGWIQTAWGEQASSAWQARAIRESALARWGTPDDIARAARFLVSPAAEFVNGQVIAVNGGWKAC